MPTKRKQDERQIEGTVAALLDDPQYAGHPAREALALLFDRYQEHLSQLERLTSISDHYQSAIRDQHQTLTDRYHKQIRQLEKIVRISDRYQKMLRDANEALKTASTHDFLTGLPNRRLMLDRLASETALVDREQPSFSLALIDIDHFKTINDRFGHEAGDQALVQLATLLLGELRAYDLCARWGGEEFLVLLPRTDGPAALRIVERLRTVVEEQRLTDVAEPVYLTVSVGVAEHTPEVAFDETIRRADDALYEAKRLGRNCTVLSDETPIIP